MKRLRLSIFGAVQGVGFRPFVYRLANEMGLAGWVLNGPFGVVVEVDGDADTLGRFARRVLSEKPRAAVIAATESAWLEPAGFSGFSIKESEAAARPSAWMLPDLATCPDCLAEICDPAQRRFGYAFTNCTACGPRFTIVTHIPYDRPNTTMRDFVMCPQCQAEYENAADRRFHAQPIACPHCGPKVWLEPGGDKPPIAEAAELIRRGGIVAVKGIGGFLLVCDARSSKTVRELRSRKRRSEKPFAVMFPNLAAVRAQCDVSKLEAEWLASAAAPIVLLRRRPEATLVAAETAPGNPCLGAMLPYAPLHHLLMAELGFPVVATSGNLSEEPIVKDNEAAQRLLAGIADAFLINDRPIARHADDSIVRLARGRQLVLRRARGLAPLPLRVGRSLRPVLALGAHLKSTVAAAWDRQIVLSQHLGDLETTASLDAWRSATRDLCALYGFKPEAVACDLHPDYASTRQAESMGLPIVRVQHHHAHVAAAMAEADLTGPVLGVAWDGVGFGPDGTIWGGEFLRVDDEGYQRVARLRPFPLPGGEAAVREPRRCALGLLFEMGGDLSRLEQDFPKDWETARLLPGRSALSPRTSSMGRLFDGLAALLGLRSVNSYEGQAAMALEHAMVLTRESYSIPLRSGEILTADWEPMVRDVLTDLERGAPTGLICGRFHNALAELTLAVAKAAGLEKVVLTGGVFQNAYLSERSVELLEASGFKVFTHQRLPPNDGAISAGQAFVAGR
jgi:hydrogenase maturation protein HypF